MKHLRLLHIGCAVLLTTLVMAQGSGKQQVAPYFRNALTTMMVFHPEDELGYELYEIFKTMPEMDKFDKHDVRLNIIDNSEVSGVKANEKGFHRQTYGGSMVLTDSEKDQNAKAILAMLNKAQVGKRMVATWFDLQGKTMTEARFSTKLLSQRTQYNATVQEGISTRYTIEGENALKAVGEDLIGHSFVLVNDMTYITAENRAKAAIITMQILGAIIDVFTQSDAGSRLAESVADIASMFTGFKVMTHSYLYQLEWDERISDIFYRKYYCEQPEPMKVLAFLEDTTSFKLKYIGTESAFYEKTKTKGKYTRRNLLELVTHQSIDNNIAKLQSEYEAFRIKTAISAVETAADDNSTVYRALVGLKEGVSEEREYEVLEAKLVKGRLVYDRVAVVKPVINHIWDNRFNAVIEGDMDIITKGTLFKPVGVVSKTIVPGMLVREL